MARLCEGRVVVVTGSGRGLGREHALEFARQGAKVVVNDLGAEVDGSGSSDGPAGEVVDLIRGMGGEAVANGDDVSDWDGAQRLVQSAVETFGTIDTLVCNAGILRDRMLVNMTVEDWDAVMRVHLRGHFCPLRHAAGYWREQTKAGNAVRGRVVLTSSEAGLWGNIGQLNYGAAKTGIATMARIAGTELARYGVTVNAIAPAARTRMTEAAMPEMMAKPDAGQFDVMDPANISPIVVWLGSDEAADVTGQIFHTTGGVLGVVSNFDDGAVQDKGDRWDPNELGPVVRELIAKSPTTHPVIGGVH
jgi:NAD(P)-dependent dehydrogenase (short-subunit alcohol dehydrogenase family)